MSLLNHPSPDASHASGGLDLLPQDVSPTQLDQACFRDPRYQRSICSSLADFNKTVTRLIRSWNDVKFALGGTPLIFRLSSRLARKVRIRNLDEVALADEPIGDWTCRLFMTDQRPYILFSNTATLYSCVIPGCEITDRDRLVAAATDAVSELLLADALERPHQKFLNASRSDPTFARSCDRLTCDSMNDHVHGSKLYLGDGLAPQEIGMRLNETPLPSLTRANGRKYGHARDVLSRLGGRRQTGS